MSAARQWLGTWARSLTTADVRSLAAFRIGLGLVLLFDLFSRLPRLRVHYSEVGILTGHFAIAANLDKLQPGYLLGLRWPLEIGLFFGFTLCVYLAFTLGFRTRIFTVLSLICALSWHSRNFMLDHAGDEMIRLLLAWSILLPLGARWSVDARVRDRDARRGPEVRSLAVAGLRLEIVAFFWLLAASKTGRSWTEGTAWHQLLWLDSMVRSGAVTVRETVPAAVLTSASYLQPMIEAAGGTLLIAGPARARSIAVAVLAVGGLLLHSLVQLGTLPLAVIVGLGVFVSGSGWERLRARLDARGSEPSSGTSRWSRWSRRLAPTPVPDAIEPHPIERRVRELAAGFFLISAVLSNAANNVRPGVALGLPPAPGWTPIIDDTLMVHRGWSLFAPELPWEDGQFVIAATTADRLSYDPITGGDVAKSLVPARGSIGTMQDVALDVRLRSGWLETMSTELVRFCWNAHLAHPGLPEAVYCDAWIVRRPTPRPGETEVAAATEELVLHYEHAEIVGVPPATSASELATPAAE